MNPRTARLAESILRKIVNNEGGYVDIDMGVFDVGHGWSEIHLTDGEKAYLRGLKVQPDDHA